MPTISIKKASLRYQNKIIFQNLAFDWPAGTWIGLIGPSGVGKTSLLKLLAGLFEPSKVDASLVLDPHFQHQIAYLPQKDSLLPWLTVTENLALKIKLSAHSAPSKKTFYQRIRQLLIASQLSHAEDLYPHQLSGGMQQRVALLRTLLEDKPIVLMDEPFAALDAITRYNLQNLAVELLHGKSVLFITHDPIEALRLSDQIWLMHNDPAQLKLIATLQSKKPRPVNNCEVQDLQPILYRQLAECSAWQ